jgi:ATP-binding protein involved in chromosome partitioning
MPLEIVALRRPTITFIWEDEHETVYAARELRLACKCAGCVEEMTGRPLLDPRTVPADVQAVAVDLVGNYAINIMWSDGHATGIFTYRDLRERCGCAQCTSRAV